MGPERAGHSALVGAGRGGEAARGGYSVTVTGSGTGGAFTIDDGQGNILNYTAEWNDVKGTSGGVSVTSGVTLTGQSGACQTATNCGTCGNNTGNIRVTIQSSEFDGKPSRDYTGSISLLVEPD